MNISSDKAPNISDLFKLLTEMNSRLEKLEKKIDDIEEIVYQGPVI